MHKRTCTLSIKNYVALDWPKEFAERHSFTKHLTKEQNNLPYTSGCAIKVTCTLDYTQGII